MASRTRLRLLPFLLVVAVSSACGSTVQSTSTAAVGGSDLGGSTGADAGLGQTPASSGPGLGAADGSTGGTTGLGVTTGAGATSGTGTGSSGGSGSGTATTGAGTTGAGTSSSGASTGGTQVAGPNGPGITATSVYVGLIYDKNAGSVNKAAGAGGITSGDSKANELAIIDDINKHGGVAGRKLEPVFANFDSQSAQTLDQQYSAICQQFSNDKPRVFAALNAGVASYRECMAKAGIALLSDDLPSIGKAEFDRYPGLIEQGYANIDRLAAYHVTPLVEQKYFTPWNTLTGQPATTGKVKVGVLTYDDSTFSSAVDRYLVPALKRAGYTPQVIKITPVKTASDYGAQGAAIKSAQLSFAQNGVTHVIPFESNGGMSLLFLTAARSQAYFPRYGISSASGFQALLDAGEADKSQMNGTVGFGWIPAVDLHSSYNPDNGPYSNANRRYCLKVMKANGIIFDSSNAQLGALYQCASLYLLKTALDTTPNHLTLSTFIGATEALGTSYQAANSLGQQFAPGRHDPSNRAYHWRWFPDCTCFHYEGALRTIP